VPDPEHRGPRHRAPEGADPEDADDSRPDDARPDDETPATAPTLLEQMGGVAGMVSSAVPVVAFVVAQAAFSTLMVSIIVALVAGAAVAGWRLVRGEALQPALAGLLGVGVCAFFAYRTGDAKGFYLPGIITSSAYGAAFLLSVLVRWPLVGVIWHAVNGHGQGWRASPTLRRGYDLASLAWVAVFAARAVVQGWLYGSQYGEDWLGWVRLAMGVPLALLAALVTVWAIRRGQAEMAATT
jgi:hypothetical protein